jgi:hypothetical protein
MNDVNNRAAMQQAALFLKKMWSLIVAYQSPFLYIRVMFWLLTIVISFLPFVGAETKMFSHWVSVEEIYSKHYEGILAVFVVTIAVAMFDVLAVVVLLMTYQSYIAVSASLIFAVLTVLLVMVGLALGAAITAQMPGQMHGGILTFSAFLCLVATMFVAILSNEYHPKAEAGTKSRSKK